MSTFDEIRQAAEDAREARRLTQMNSNGRIRIDPMVAFQVIAWIVAALVTYGAINARVSVVESRQGESDRRLQRIEDKVDQLLQRRLP
jgi:hypothetical protein